MNATGNTTFVAEDSLTVADLSERIRNSAAGLRYCVHTLRADNRGYYIEDQLISTCDDKGGVVEALLPEIHSLTYALHNQTGHKRFSVYDRQAWSFAVLRWTGPNRVLCLIGRAADFGLVPGGGIEEEARLAWALQLAGIVYDDFLRNHSKAGHRLTDREIDCLQWACRGKTSEEIGIIFGLSHHTINQHLHSVTRKLGAANRMHAVAMALNNGIISLQD